MERNPPLDRLRFIEKTYGEKQPWVVLDALSVIAPTIGVDDLRGACDEAIGEMIDAGEWRTAGAARYSNGGDYSLLDALFSARDASLIPALSLIVNDNALNDGPISQTEALAAWTGSSVRHRASLLLLDTVANPRFDERMREPHQADGIFPWVATQLSKLSKAVLQHPPLYGDYIAALRLLRKRGNAIAQWAKLNRVDIGKKTLAEVLEATAQFRVSGTNVRQGRVDFEYDDGWTMQELRTKRELKDEGHVMQHCVGGYCDDVASGKSQIFSLRDADGNPHATIEWQPPEDAKSMSRERRTGHFEQIFGVQNEEITDPAIVERVVRWIRARFPEDASGELLLGRREFAGRILDLRGEWAQMRARVFATYDFESATIFLNTNTRFENCNLSNAKIYCDGRFQIFVEEGTRAPNAIFFIGSRITANFDSSNAAGAHFAAMEDVEQPTLLLEAASSVFDGVTVDEGVTVESLISRDTTWHGADLLHVDWGYRGGHRGTTITDLQSLEDIAASNDVKLNTTTMWPRERAIVSSSDGETVSEEAFDRAMREMDDY